MTSESKSLEASIRRPIALSIVSAFTFILGLAGTLSATIIGVAVLSRPINIPSIYVNVTILWFVIGPLLILSGYNLWKMKKWAAQLAAIIYFLDLITYPIIFGIDIGYIVGGPINIICLILIALSWGHLQPPSILSHLTQEIKKWCS